MEVRSEDPPMRSDPKTKEEEWLATCSRFCRQFHWFCLTTMHQQQQFRGKMSQMILWYLVNKSKFEICVIRGNDRELVRFVSLIPLNIQEKHHS